jgi:hypothetical protein
VHIGDITDYLKGSIQALAGCFYYPCKSPKGKHSFHPKHIVGIFSILNECQQFWYNANNLRWLETNTDEEVYMDKEKQQAKGVGDKTA